LQQSKASNIAGKSKRSLYSNIRNLRQKENTDNMIFTIKIIDFNCGINKRGDSNEPPQKE